MGDCDRVRRAATLGLLAATIMLLAALTATAAASTFHPSASTHVVAAPTEPAVTLAPAPTASHAAAPPAASVAQAPPGTGDPDYQQVAPGTTHTTPTHTTPTETTTTTTTTTTTPSEQQGAAPSQGQGQETGAGTQGAGAALPGGVSVARALPGTGFDALLVAAAGLAALLLGLVLRRASIAMAPAAVAVLRLAEPADARNKALQRAIDNLGRARPGRTGPERSPFAMLAVTAWGPPADAGVR